MELNIYFKNVGQGDTIFLDWFDDRINKKKYGLIDCNLVNNGIDQVIKHILNDKNDPITEFDFVLMSHPHSDHFSGFLDFLSFCEINNIIIKKFLHTGGYDPVLLKTMFSEKGKKIESSDFKGIVTSTVNFENHKEALWSLYRKLNKLNKEQHSIINDVFVVNNDYPIQMTSNISLRFLSPYLNEEMKEYLIGTYKAQGSEKIVITQERENNPKANYLSTFIQLYSETENWQIFLTSDSTNYTFKKLIDKKWDLIKERNLLAAQVPHHGSAYNHVQNFWDLAFYNKKPPMIISVGEGYNHPDVDVVKYFDENSKSVHATNFVGGYKEYYSKKSSQNGTFFISSLTKMPGIGFNLFTEDFTRANNCPKCCEKWLKICKVDGETTCIVVDVE